MDGGQSRGQGGGAGDFVQRSFKYNLLNLTRAMNTDEPLEVTKQSQRKLNMPGMV